MNIQNDILYKIADKIYQFFIVNRTAIAVQLADGNYVTKYTKISENEIYYMLQEGKSLGTYQQLYKSPYLKWICFDFDCKDKERPNVEKLYSECTAPLNRYLDEKQIYYINEFSGRRGIHTWILFDNFVKKDDAYDLVQDIKRNVDWKYDDKEFGLDQFPATRSSKGNVVGKQVKVPLSIHKKGGRSFLFSGRFQPKFVDDSFFLDQLSILESIKLNSFADLSEKNGLNHSNFTGNYTRTYFVGSLKCSSERVIEILSQTKVYKTILERVMNGNAMTKDWLVMLGTLGKINDGYHMLKEIFRYCPTFSEGETDSKIEKYGKNYYPATFGYLYNLYDLDMESWLDSEETGLHYLTAKLGVENGVQEWSQNELMVLDDSKYTLDKELNYLFVNDEVPVVSVYHDLKHMTGYDTEKINQIVQEIRDGNAVEIRPSGYYVFERQESEERYRTMVSLSAFDRVLTSHIALNVFYKFNRQLKSYSYNPNYISSEEMFYHWFSSWGNYLSQIRKYIDVDLYNNMHVLTIDIRHFYDDIDFMGVYNILKDNFSIQDNSLFRFLIKYNEFLMNDINKDRKGVPQGPAYARIIAEAFLGSLIQSALDGLGEKREHIHLYRYVDDIIVFYDSEVEGNLIFQNFEKVFARHGLVVNREKSKIYGEIGKLTEKQKAELLRSDQFQYGLRVAEYSFLTENEYVNEKLNILIDKKGGFNVKDINYYFSKLTTDQAKLFCFTRYSTQILSATIGRGSGYQLFYKYVFETPHILDHCIERNLFKSVPINTLNFSCLLAVMFYAFEDNKVSQKNKKGLIENYLKQIDVNLIEGGEDKSIILSLSKS